MENPSKPDLRRRSVVLCYLGVLLAVTVAGVLRFVISDDTVTYHFDYDIYRGGGQAVLDGASLYNQSFQAQGITLPFTYPPLSALVFAPLALVSSNLGFTVFTVLSVLALLATTVIVLNALAGEVAGRTGFTVTRRQLTLAALLVLPLAVWLWPVTHTLEFGQINVILMLMVAADLLLPRTPWPRGMMIGLAAALKLTPAVFGLYLLLRRQWGPAVTSVVSGLGASALAWLVLPADSRQYWTETISDPSRIGGLAYSANQSVRGMIARFTDDPLQTGLWYVFAAVTVVLIAVVMVRLFSVGAYTAAVCTNALLALLVSPVSWAHHWVWVLPLMLVVGVSLWTRVAAHRTGPGVIPLAVLGVVLVLVSTAFPVHVYLPSAHGAEQDWSLVMKLLGSEYVLAALLWLGVAGVWPRVFRPVHPGAAESPGAPESPESGTELRDGNEGIAGGACSPAPGPNPVQTPPDNPDRRSATP
ncbi:MULTISPECIES: glycosyltransferase 87 family protein [unclassified Corynebacterium]|uniref:glycosyltransferase 87 family protein n=1 Tax=unclassified Corynebacterium TaxID=2624378 RepID=UPI002649DB02|nr:glycosyltransferase 87 family protein [Corynebacterium sp.]MDN5582359.1 glycosyltransferase 87 family protein [Corynebacterium sp.]MDN5719003.1 glycosyltransferase 87 family protein [Corynebacterium sp.]MDN6324159.1 glycosyltransferase 87 family protein [Corynebacterium sp.]